MEKTLQMTSRPFNRSIFPQVVFDLHSDYPKPERTVRRAPYCVKETGYGGFNIPIYIYFQTNEKNLIKVGILLYYG